ncbi:RES family NAD+ phosphorylase [Fuerstiella marisgermanici]|uniref:RES family NAD+ phosphorylase n=1 Tax=Fuerstiella marisgermanici TaxID=1891926 RepID=UPI001C54E69A|nr:RES family NAD+ phosphorylase [Fuerstiella marisgermanici]
MSDSKGTCPTCGAINTKLVEASRLAEYFDPVCGIYTPNVSGKVLVDWLIDDWQAFALDRANANLLLIEILDDGERTREAMVPSSRCLTKRLQDWEQFRDELRYRNRFFPETEIELERLEDLFASIIAIDEDIPASWSRARISQDGKVFTQKKMGAPPQDRTTHGRANPAGIPYLYLASTVQTAVSEVRPHPGETVCVAEFKLKRGAKIKLLDLRNPRALVSPFLLGDESAIALLRGDVEFLERIGSELTTPVLPTAAAIEYIPSQYMCEFIKKCKYSGVLYTSSVTEGVNLALFDPALATVGKVKRHRIDSMSFETSEL